MYRIVLLLIIFIIQFNVSHASFPVYAYSSLDVLQTEEIKKYHFNLQKMGFNLSLCKCISCRKGIAPLMMRSDPLPMKLDKIIEEDKMENIIKENKDLSGGMYVFLSVMSAIGSFFFGLLSLGNALSQTGSDSAVLSLFLLSMISVIGSILLGVKAKNKGVNFWLAMLGVGISVLAVLFLFPIFFP